MSDFSENVSPTINDTLLSNFSSLFSKNLFQSMWISASAGSGKTKTLVDRILALMLCHQKSQHILCLTFTRKACQEMQERLMTTLKQWQIMDPETLLDHLLPYLDPGALQNSFCHLSFIKENFHQRVQNLYRHIQQHPLAIYTFHEFCHRWLLPKNQKAPQSSFSLLDAYQSFQLWKQSYEKVMQDLGHHPLFCWETSCPHRKAFFRHLGSFNIQNIVEEMFENRLNLGLSPCPSFSNPAYENKGMESLFGFLTSGPIPCTKTAVRDFFYLLYQSILENYEKAKHHFNVLDFEDLMRQPLQRFQNLQESGSLELSLYYQWHHVLVDEAQDNSPLQWQLLKHLIESILQSRERTFFVVGDPKQSIYSFQGADVGHFESMKNFLESWTSHYRLPFAKETLSVVYRSGSQILTWINDLFSKLSITKESFPLHTNGLQHQGYVEWFLATASPKGDLSLKNSQQLLIQRWISRLKEWKSHPFWLASQKRFMTLDDVVCLWPRRSAFFMEFKQALAKENLLGYCEHMVQEHPGFLALVALGKWLIDPDADTAFYHFFSTAFPDASFMGILRNPQDDILFQGKAHPLFFLAYRRGEHSLWNQGKIFIAQSKTQDFLENLSLSGEVLNGLKPWIQQAEEWLQCHQEKIHLQVSKDSKQILALTQTLEMLFQNPCPLFPEGILVHFSKLYGKEIFLFAKDLLEKLESWMVFKDSEISSENLQLSVNAESLCPHTAHYLRGAQEALSWVETLRFPCHRENGIHLQTIHATKGAQFPVVILPDLPNILDQESSLLRKILEEKSPKTFPSSHSSAKDEYWRLLYVALTRAQDALFISATQRQKDWGQKVFNTLEHLPNIRMEKESWRFTNDPSIPWICASKEDPSALSFDVYSLGPSLSFTHLELQEKKCYSGQEEN